MLSTAYNEWSVSDLPRMNRAVLSGAAKPEELAARFSRFVLADLPDPRSVRASDARRLVVVLGMTGSSIARHYQERDISLKTRPHKSFQDLHVGAQRTPFLAYFAELTAATGTGHSPRDSYASLVRWNLPTAEVIADGKVVASLPGSFPDTATRTYTADPGEVSFFELLKASEAYELAVNDTLEPLAQGAIGILSQEAGERVELATRVLAALYRINLGFSLQSSQGRGLSTEHFMDVFRQFAVHWQAGDIPPSGAQDPEFLRRDLLLGIDFPGYTKHVRRVFPALLAAERRTLGHAMARPTLPSMLLDAVGLQGEDLESMPTDRLHAVVREHPQLALWYLLLKANARIGAVHLMLTEKFLFKPQRTRDARGVGDRPLVSNRRGTTGMDEPLLVQLARARQRHPLSAFGRIPDSDLEQIARGQALPDGMRAERIPTVRFTPGCP